jgi:hypothetical protein
MLSEKMLSERIMSDQTKMSSRSELSNPEPICFAEVIELQQRSNL